MLRFWKGLRSHGQSFERVLQPVEGYRHLGLPIKSSRTVTVFS
jgi:hypothetical protein